jgi:RimJ/RimL family protein N-acetyltransferase
VGSRTETHLSAVPVELPEKLTDGVVTLRPWHVSDARTLAATCNEPSLAQWLPMIPYPYTEANALEFISAQPQRNAEGSGNVGIFDAETGELLGACGFRAKDSERVEFGYWVGLEHRGQGIAPRALRLLTRWVAETLGAKRLQLHADVDNLPSQRVAEKAGFTREGVQRSWLEIRGERRDMVSYSLLPEEL